MFPRLPNLKHINFTFSRLDEHSLQGILASCNNLCSFSYESAHSSNFFRDGYFDPHNDGDHFYLSNAVKYLSYHRRTLKSIHLDLRRRVQDKDWKDSKARFSFRGFLALEHLFLNLDEFHTRFWLRDDDHQLFVQVLPPNIVSLDLAGFIGSQLPRLELALSGLADAVSAGQFARLNRLRWDRNEKFRDAIEFNVSNIFSEAGNPPLLDPESPDF
ncbi:uncharacterized protein BDV14DRAFT_197665 [Aspergillus stella-maris]|uniref:uncharacterized protein n=1 Tax=Aspergillus stella-maris TaxID=1810926 RepID=UPI003CCD3380